MATYVNNLRLTELATGEGSGTWGTTTNTSLELIGEALGYNTQDCFASDADATTTVADGATDPARAMYFKVTSSATLTATRTLTIAPNTLSRVMFIENATTGSQSIAISQGSGANVTIATGKTAVVYLDGAGSTAAVVDAMAGVDPGITDTLAEVLVAGNTTGGTSLVVSSGDDVTFTGASANIVFDSSDSALEFADNAKAIFGAGSDLEIYSDGSTSYIREAGPGNLRITGANVQITDASFNKYFLGSGDVARLYHSDAEKLATTSTGIDVTGTAVTDGVTVDGVLGFVANASFPTTGLVLYTNNYLYQRGGSSGIIFSDASGTNEIARFTPATVTFNEDSNNQDFRVESDSNTHALFVDAGDSRVGINENSPNAMLHVKTNGTDEMLRLEMVDDSNTIGPDLVLQRTSASPAANDVVGRFRAIGENSSGSGVTYGRMEFVIDDPTAASEDGRITFSTELGGANIQRLAFKPDEIVFNEPSVDSDFRVESDGNANMLFVDAGNDHVNIGTSTDLGEVLNVSGGIAATDNTGSTVKFQWSAASERLTLKTSGAFALDVQASANTSATMAQFSNNNGSDKAYIALDSTGAGKIVLLDGGNNEDVLIQASGTSYYNTGGNFLIGKSSADLSEDGIELRDVGLLGATRSSNPPLLLRRNTNDGEIASFYRDSNVIGNVGVTDGDLNIYSTAASHGGLRLGNGYVGPTNNAGTITDDAISLGLSGQRFTNLYLSDSVQNTGKAGSESVFNDGSTTADFRVESDNNSHMLFVDAGNDFVGINKGTPEAVLHVKSASSGTVTTFESSSANNSAGPNIRLWRNSASPADGDALARLIFQGNNDAAERIDFVEIQTEIVDASDGTEDGQLDIQTMVAGVSRTRLRLNGTESIFNDGGRDIDFRVESDSNTHALFVEAGHGSVLVGTSTAPASNNPKAVRYGVGVQGGSLSSSVAVTASTVTDMIDTAGVVSGMTGTGLYLVSIVRDGGSYGTHFVGIFGVGSSVALYETLQSNGITISVSGTVIRASCANTDVFMTNMIPLTIDN